MFGICIPRRDLNTFILDLSDAKWTPICLWAFWVSTVLPCSIRRPGCTCNSCCLWFLHLSSPSYICALLPSTPSTQQTARSSTKIERCKYFFHVDNDIYDLSVIRRWQSSSCPPSPTFSFSPPHYFLDPFSRQLPSSETVCLTWLLCHLTLFHKHRNCLSLAEAWPFSYGFLSYSKAAAGNRQLRLVVSGWTQAKIIWGMHGCFKDP